MMSRFAVLGVFAACLLAPELAAQAKRPQRPPDPPAHLVLERLSRLTPAERDRMFARVPAEKRALLEQRLDKYKTLPAPQKDRLREEYNQFIQLTPDQQNEVRRIFRQFTEIPEERRKIVRRELYRLRSLPRQRRTMRQNSEAYRTEYSDSERQMLDTLIALLSKDQPPAAQTAAH